MATQQALARPIEITSSISITVTGTPSDTSTVTAGVYANVFDLAREFRDNFATISCNFNIGNSFSGSVLNRISMFPNNTPTAISGTGLAYLGFDGTETPQSGGLYFIANDAPQYTWLPAYHSKDPGLFLKDNSKEFNGTTSMTGRLSGVGFTNIRQKRKAEWNYDFAHNVVTEAPGSTSIQQARCFEKIISESRTAISANTTTPRYIRGLYFIEDLSQYSGTFDDTWTEGAQDDNYIFCSAGPAKVGNASIDNSKSYYDCSVELTSSTIPSWD